MVPQETTRHQVDRRVVTVQSYWQVRNRSLSPSLLVTVKRHLCLSTGRKETVPLQARKFVSGDPYRQVVEWLIGMSLL